MRREADEAAWERLRTQPRPAHDDAFAPGIGVRRLQLIVAPSFEPVSVWEIRQGDEWQLVRPRVVETVPNLLVVGHEVVPFPSTELAIYFERLARLDLPLRPVLDRVGLDGTRYELAMFGDMFSRWRFGWWCEGPESWRPLTGLAREMLAAFAAAADADEESGRST